jgi:ribonuclease HI
MKQETIYTDGACKGNPGPGGWGAILTYDEHEKEISGGEAETTNNRMEMMSALEALRSLKTPCKVTLFTDSTYLLKGITEWLPAWKARGWRTADKKPVKNADIWQMLEVEAQRHQVTWRWVKGHNGDVMNERADRLASAAVPSPLKAARG